VEEKIEDKEFLEAIIDWLQITFKNVALKTVINDILQFDESMMVSEDRGRIGYYKKMKFGGIEILLPLEEKKEEMGYHVYMTGSTCREFEIYLNGQQRTWYDFLGKCLEYECNFSRLDIAIDDRKTHFKIDALKSKVKKRECITRMRAWSFVDGGTTSGKATGKTLNIGARGSDVSVVFYEKNLEQAKKLNCDPVIFGKWNRYEIRMRDKIAYSCVEKIVESGSVGHIGLGVLNHHMRFAVTGKGKNRSRWKIWRPWANLMEGIKGIKLSMRPAPKGIEQKKAWVRDYVAPTLKMIQIVDRELSLSSYLEEVIGEAILKKEQVAMVEGYVTEYKNWKDGSEKERQELIDLLDLKANGFEEIFCEKDIPFSFS